MWDVFVSHRGPDTKRSFVEYLQLALPGRDVFVDRVSLRKGEVGWDTIVGALCTARIVLIVLSPRYQESPWCLEELRIAFQQKKQRGVEIFVVCYGAGVQNINEDALKKSLEQWQQHHGAENPLADWREALEAARSIVGDWHDPERESLPDLVNQIAREIEQRLPPLGIGSSLDKIGLLGHLERISELLENQAGPVKEIGLWGMGGVGKTTIAEALRNMLSRGFSGKSTCYLKGIRDQARQPEGFLHMQKKLLKALLNNPVSTPVNDTEGLDELRRRLQGCRILLILDDVDEGNIPNCIDISRLGEGSVVIVTTRNRRALDNQGILVERVQLREAAESRLIFLQQACRRGGEVIPLRVSGEVVDEVVKYCGGLPLSLKVRF